MSRFPEVMSTWASDIAAYRGGALHGRRGDCNANRRASAPIDFEIVVRSQRRLIACLRH